ncbi:MAG: CHRD domain-containing protein [Alphaproteobacteria bacterium]|nr:CHRD domain-containing protein [Alphaproteobacteria bacterium]MBV9585502.1 CHRD domain-containing protein [Alphaproteobacteria bacterium]MBV9965978.1 CHRD domain-containing protein [Alphaproteobacteria bacterium]
MRKTALTIALFAAAAFTYANAATVAYKANLAGGTEVPPIQSPGKGSATVNVDTATKQVTYRVEFSGLSGPAAAAHIHCGAAAGANAGVAVPLGGANPTSPITGQATMTDAQIADLQAGKCYVNVHTAANKGGEIRGQLAP